MSDVIRRDIVGIGFGPSNIALAIALEERLGRSALQATVLFVESQAVSAWHRAMLMPGTTLQVSFLKDLVTLRNPMSPYTFLNFLQQAGRLDTFVNLRTLFPHRLDFAQYIEWVAEQFRSVTIYGEAVTDVSPVVERGHVDRLRVSVVSGKTFETSRLAIATGGRPSIPEPFRDVVGPRLFHAADYLSRIPPASILEGRRVVVIGGGQSAAEIVHHLATEVRGVTTVCIIRDFALRASDDSHFVNEAFFPSCVDYTYGLSPARRREMLASLRMTNYGVVDADLLESLYRTMYEGRLRGLEPVRFIRHTIVDRARLRGDEVVLDCVNVMTDERSHVATDYVVLATGYHRLPLPEYLASLRDYLVTDTDGQPVLDRQFRVLGNDRFEPTVYLLGFSEHSHGIADTLLSLAAERAGVIAQSIVESLQGRRAARE